jgi:hypothetical protein
MDGLEAVRAVLPTGASTRARLRSRVARLSAAIVAAATLLPRPAAATVLTFEGLGLPQPPEYDAVPGSYGDATDPTCDTGGCCDGAGCYGEGMGFTPNVTIEYRTVDASTSAQLQPQLLYWDTDYGDLADVAIPAQDNALGEVALVPEPGYRVILHGFDLGGWNRTDRANQTVRVLDTDGNVLGNFGPMTVEGDGGHTHVAPVTPIVSATTLRIQFGPRWDVGIDNVSFAQEIDNAFLQCQEDLATATADTDGDGRRDLDDACPDTTPGAEVDVRGCSQGQFCAAIAATDRVGRKACKRADWGNDEPVMPGTSRDCAVNRGARGAADDLCVATSP